MAQQEVVPPMPMGAKALHDLYREMALRENWPALSSRSSSDTCCRTTLSFGTLAPGSCGGGRVLVEHQRVDYAAFFQPPGRRNGAVTGNPVTRAFRKCDDCDEANTKVLQRRHLSRGLWL